jgi:hypothetical protein
MRIAGGCLCGAVRFIGDAEPQFQVKCYCDDCRKTSGAGHSAMMGFLDDAIDFSGEAREFVSRADSGNDIIRAFCPNCGSGIYSCNAGMPHLIFVRAATLDDPNLFSPQMAVWASRAPSFDAATSAIPTFAEAPRNARGEQP